MYRGTSFHAEPFGQTTTINRPLALVIADAQEMVGNRGRANDGFRFRV